MGSSTVQKKERNLSRSTSKTTNDKIQKTHTDEFIIGICSPIGSDSTNTIEEIKNRLKEYDYDVEVIKLSKFIEEYYKEEEKEEIGKTPAFTKLMNKIKGGDHLRQRYENNSILVELAIKKIREDRDEKDTLEVKSRRKCYIIDSLKNVEELILLQSIYREIFYLFSIFSPEKERKSNLRKIGLNDQEIEKIISTDDYENNDNGQNVRDTFIKGDFFLRISEDNKSDLKKKIKRYIHLIFASEIVTPNYDETAMYQAKSSAGNSACLSRQVGATITNRNGVVIARGWNDVPKFKGNLYQNENNAQRCKDLGYCSNVQHREDILSDIEEEINKVLNHKPTDKLSLVQDISKETKAIMRIIRNSRFKNIIEYSRSIHAEMHAIIIGSQMTSDNMVGGNLYCTTYPCHNCARHIILAGIEKIYYIEPYKKSLGITLHKDALTEDEDDLKKVRILAYDGVSPRRYLDFFGMKEERKYKDGKIVKIDIKSATPRNRVSLQAIPTLENQAIHALVECGIIEGEDDA